VGSRHDVGTPSRGNDEARGGASAREPEDVSCSLHSREVLAHQARQTTSDVASRDDAEMNNGARAFRRGSDDLPMDDEHLHLASVACEATDERRAIGCRGP